MTEPRFDPEDGGAPRLEVRVTEWERACRCGSRIARGTHYLEVAELPSSLEALFRGEAFCTPACVRAGVLEDLSVLEAILSPDTERQVSDLREAYVHLSSAYAKLFDGTRGAAGAGPSNEWVGDAVRRPWVASDARSMLPEA